MAELVAMRDLAKAYAGRWAVRDLSLTLERGEILGLLGGNGAGKTTTLRLLAGLLRPDRAKGHVLGLDLNHQRDLLRGRVGCMSQAQALYGELSLRENLLARARLFNLPHATEVVDRLITAQGLDRYADHLAQQVSHGWHRQALFAAAMVHTPELVILDEPTSGLDVEARDRLWRTITATAANGAGIILSTHDLGEAQACSKVALFHGGQIIALTAPAALIQETGAADFTQALKARLAAWHHDA